MQIQINDSTHQVPQSWNEMSTRRQLAAYEILLQATRLQLTPEEIVTAQKLALTRYFLDLTDDTLTSWEADRIAELGPIDGHLAFHEELHQLTSCVDWMFEENPDGPPRLRYTLTRCPYPQLTDPTARTDLRTLYAPADELANISIYEMGLAFHAFEQFAHTSDAQHLHRLLAILYRPGKPDTRYNRRADYEGDRRLPLLKHESTIDARAERLATIPYAVQRLLLFWFASCRARILDAYPNIFSTEQQVGERVGNDYGWGGLLLSLADGLVHIDTVSEQNYANALTYLSYLEDQRKLADIRARNSKK